MEEDAKKKKKTSVNHDVKTRILWFYLRIAFMPTNNGQI